MTLLVLTAVTILVTYRLLRHRAQEGVNRAPAKRRRNMTDKLTTAVQMALRRAPGSVRMLEREGHLAHPTLTRIGRGRRPVTPETAEKLANALARWATNCRDAEAMIRKALDERSYE